MELIQAENIISENIRKTVSPLADFRYMTDAHIREFALLLAANVTRQQTEDGADGESGKDIGLSDDVTDVIRADYCDFIGKCGSPDRAAENYLRVKLCRTLWEELKNRGTPDYTVPLFGEDEDAPEIPDVAYFPNRASDDAFGLFTKFFGRAEACFCDGLNSVCEDVASGRADFGLLPIGSSSDGTILNTYKLMEKYGLYVVCEADVKITGDFSVRFALASAVLCRFDGADTLNVTVVPENRHGITWLISALPSLGAYLSDMILLPAAQFGGNSAYVLKLKIEVSDVSPLRLFLGLNYPRYGIGGFYKLIHG